MRPHFGDEHPALDWTVMLEDALGLMTVHPYFIVLFLLNLHLLGLLLGLYFSG